MDIDVIRKTLDERPFRAVIFHLDNGEKHIIRHPEIIVTDIYVLAVDDAGLPVFIKPEAISSIHYARNIKPRRARRRKRAASRR